MSNDAETPLVQDELATLKARADMLNVTYHPSIGVEKLREKIAAALAEDSTAPAGEAPAAAAPPEPPVVAQAPEGESDAQRRVRKRREANELVRISLTCMNPAKKEWEGEIICAGNSLVGSVKKYIPFNADEGWHVPRIIYEVLKARQCQVFTTIKSKNGVSVRQGKLIKEFAIDVLPALTRDELDELARRQAMSRSVD